MNIQPRNHLSITQFLWASLLTLSALTSLPALADDKIFKQVGDHKVYFSAFNSSFIQPNIASIYNIVRGKDKGLVNIAVVANDTSNGQTAQISGYVSNILAQQQFLKFFEVREGDAVYYLAPFEFENEDSLTFKIEVRATPSSPSELISFQRTFYHEE